MQDKLNRRAGLKRLHFSLLAAMAVAAWPHSVWADARRGASGASAGPVLVLGDSLSAEYGIARGTGWVARLANKLQGRTPPVRVVNASISGDTSSGGRTRLPPLLKTHAPAVVVIELGANDALRGLPVSALRENLIAMTQAAQAAGAKVLILGTQVPPNYGSAYTREFAEAFASVAKQTGAAVVPFFMAGVADAPNADRLFQADRLHPTAEAQAQLLANVWPKLEPLVAGVHATRR